MAERVEVDADKLSNAARIPEATSATVTHVVNTLKTTLDGLEGDTKNPPWGDDKNGKKFADGDKGYKAIRENMVTGGSNMGNGLHEFAAGERSAAEEFRKAESGSTEGLGGKP